MAPAAPPPLDAPDAEVEEEDPEEAEQWVPFSDLEPDLALEPFTPSPEREPGPEPQQQPPPPAALTAPARVPKEKGEGEEARPRWPGWPGASVFRLVVPAEKVGCLIGHRGETIKRLCVETRARVRILDAAHGASSRIVLVSAREEVEAVISPAMNAAMKIFKHINEIEDIKSDGPISASAPEICSVRLLVPSAQAVHLIGKQGITIQSIEESSGATIRVIDKDGLLSCETVDERIVEIRGASLKVHNALKSVLGLLRKFLVDHGVLHLFQRKNQEVDQAHDTCNENQVIDDYPLPLNQKFMLSDERIHGYPKGNTLLYGRDTSFLDPYSSDVSRPADSLITQIIQTMQLQIPLPYAEEIIGMRGKNIEFIRSISGAVVVLEEIGDYPSEVLVTIKGSPSQVQTAHQLVQDVLSGNRELASRSSHSNVDPGPRLVMGSPHAGPRLLHSPHAFVTSRDYLPSYHEDQLSCDRQWRSSAHRGYRGYRP